MVHENFFHLNCSCILRTFITLSMSCTYGIFSLLLYFQSLLHFHVNLQCAPEVLHQRFSLHLKLRYSFHCKRKKDKYLDQYPDQFIAWLIYKFYDDDRRSQSLTRFDTVNCVAIDSPSGNTTP